MMPALTVHAGRPMADSREVAATFGRQHKDVLRAYRDLHCSSDFRQRNFTPFKIKDLSGESLSHVLMSRNGFAFLVLGFTGATAGVFKEAYVERFDAMEAELRGQGQDNIPTLPRTLPEALRLAADLAEQVAARNAEIAVLGPRSEALATLAETVGSFCTRDAAKALQTTERGLRAYLSANGWIYRREPAGPWCARAERLSQGWMVTRVVAVETGTGKPWNRPQARITSRGLAVLAMRLGKPMPPEAVTPPGPLFSIASARA